MGPVLKATSVTQARLQMEAPNSPILLMVRRAISVLLASFASLEILALLIVHRVRTGMDLEQELVLTVKLVQVAIFVRLQRS